MAGRNGQGLSIRNAEVGPCGLVLPPGLSWDKWLEVGRALNEADRKIQWLIGDWWAYGEHEYGTRLEACKEIRWLPSPKTCANYGTVSRAFDFERRRESLSFSHHEAVAALDPPAADELLKEAEKKGWNRENLRAAVAAGDRDARQELPAGREVSDEPCPFDDGAEYEEDDEPAVTGPPPAATGATATKPKPPTLAERLKIERSRGVKTAEALMRCFDDLQQMRPREEHDTAIGICKRLVKLAEGWT